MRTGSADVPMTEAPSAMMADGTDARKLKIDHIIYQLMELGVSRQELENKSRWDMIVMLRKLKALE